MSKAAFTIVAKNYIGLACILQSSIKKYDPDIDFFIIVADEFSQKVQLAENILIAKDNLDIDTERWVNMTFKYDLTEFCTSIKPASFAYLFKKGYDKVIYFDPDIYVFSSLKPIYDVLGCKSAVLTPQVCGIHRIYGGEHPEYAMMLNGIFNLGFLGLKRTPFTERFILWWDTRLDTMCFAERTMGYFTDQKWVDWLPGFIDSDQLYVSPNLGMNLAPWNYFERAIVKENNKFYVKYRGNENSYRKDPLIFMHFAGYDYNSLKDGEIRRKRIESLSEYPDILEVLQVYRDAIMANNMLFDSYIDQSYSYGQYDNGSNIDKFHRRIYDGLVQEGLKIKNPFSIKDGSFYREIVRVRLISKNLNVDKVNSRNMANISSRQRLINFLFTLLLKVAGYERYSYFIRSLVYYARMQNHIFLVKKNNIYD